MANILIVDDEKNILASLSRAFTLEGYTPFTASNGLEALEILKVENINLVLTDLKMPVMDGHSLLKKAKALNSDLEIIVFTAHGSVEDAVNAMQNGAYNFLTKPLNLNHLFLLVNQALTKQNLQQQTIVLKEQLANQTKKNSSFIFKSKVMQDIYSLLEKTSASKASVLLLGESGVGKEVAADTLHALSSRSDKPFIKVHCAALSETLLESELFGHEKGAFTGANSLRKGRFELANGGTIFLDEIGEINQSMQIKLLRVLQDKTFERVGGEKSISSDVRIIAATNRNLLDEVKKGNFREDLYYRLNVISITIPPLRDRKDDIKVLANSFLEQFSLENTKKIESFTDEVVKYLLNYSWAGNVRQLRNCIESSVVMCNTNQITKKDLPSYLLQSSLDNEIKISLDLSLDKVEEQFMAAVLLKYNGNKTKASDSLGLNRKTLQRKLGDNNTYE